jgi:hypothetical protein
MAVSDLVEPLLHRFGRLHHQREDFGNAGEFEGRVHHPALSLPHLAVGDEDAVAEDLVENRPHQIALGVAIHILVEDAVDDVGLG